MTIRLAKKHVTPEKWAELIEECCILNADVLDVEVRGWTVFDSLRREELLKEVK
jgi:predicted transcriptional regulator